eukprot:5105218-Amphidinium_carterae.1
MKSSQSTRNHAMEALSQGARNPRQARVASIKLQSGGNNCPSQTLTLTHSPEASNTVHGHTCIQAQRESQ